MSVAETVYIPLLVAAMSFLGTLAAAAVAGHFTRRNEHEKWLRQERLEAYAKFISAVNQYYDDILLRGGLPFDGQALLDFLQQLRLSRLALTDAQAVVVMLGSRTTVEASRLLVRVLKDYELGERDPNALVTYRDKVVPVRRDFVQVAKAELGLAIKTREDFPIDT